MFEILILVVLAFQDKAPPVPAETPEHKVIRIIYEFNTKAYTRSLNLYGECLQKAGKRRDDRSWCENNIAPNVERQERMVEREKLQLDSVDTCTKLHHETIDKKTSDLTVRESAALKACQALDLYPFDMGAQPQKQP